MTYQYCVHNRFPLFPRGQKNCSLTFICNFRTKFHFVLCLMLFWINNVQPWKESMSLRWQMRAFSVKHVLPLSDLWDSLCCNHGRLSKEQLFRNRTMNNNINNRCITAAYYYHLLLSKDLHTKSTFCKHMWECMWVYAILSVSILN